MSNLKPTYVEPWALAADATGAYVLFDPKMYWSEVCSDDDEFDLSDRRLVQVGIDERRLAVHSTSWRPGKDVRVDTFVTLVECPTEFVYDRWPMAAPLEFERLLDATGNPLPHDPAGPPMPRDLDVLLHGLRHYALLLHPLIGDADTRMRLEGTPWIDILTPLPPALAGLYRGRDLQIAA